MSEADQRNAYISLLLSGNQFCYGAVWGGDVHRRRTRSFLPTEAFIQPEGITFPLSSGRNLPQTHLRISQEFSKAFRLFFSYIFSFLGFAAEVSGLVRSYKETTVKIRCFYLRSRLTQTHICPPPSDPAPSSTATVIVIIMWWLLPNSS